MKAKSQIMAMKVILDLISQWDVRALKLFKEGKNGSVAQITANTFRDVYLHLTYHIYLPGSEGALRA